MLLRETGFSFGGVHSRNDMGLIYAEKDGHIAIPEIKRNSYPIAGMSGTVLMDGEAWQPFTLEGTLYPAEEPATQADAQALLRDVAAWLTAGRQRLIFDYEPDKYYLAELSAASKWSLKNWFGGELPVRWLAQPFAYNVAESTSTTETGASLTNVGLTVSTGRGASLKMTVTNLGTASITRVSVGRIAFSGMSLGNGQSLTIDTEPPAGATIGGDSAMRYAAAFAPVEVYNGANNLLVGLSFGSGTPRARITASARGRW